MRGSKVCACSLPVCLRRRRTRRLSAPSWRLTILAFDTIHNPHIDSQLEPTERYVRVTRGHCDCSTMLGSLHARQPKERDIAKLRRKGWSDTKIQRWLQSKEHGVRAPATPQGELTRDEWMAFLRDALDEGSVPYLGLMMHWYRRSPEDEQIHVARRSACWQISGMRLIPGSRMSSTSSIGVRTLPRATPEAEHRSAVPRVRIVIR